MPDSHDRLIRQAGETAKALTGKCIKQKINIALAESCTAGLISALIADTSGASSVLWGSFVCYMKDAKMKMLDLDGSDLDKYGLVSKETALSMAQGALAKSGADIAAAVTGLAEGGGNGLPAGTVWIAAALKNGEVKTEEFHFSGSRNEVRARAAISVLEMIEKYLPVVY